jgi:hypothetical protein
MSGGRVRQPSCPEGISLPKCSRTVDTDDGEPNWFKAALDRVGAVPWGRAGACLAQFRPKVRDQAVERLKKHARHAPSSQARSRKRVAVPPEATRRAPESRAISNACAYEASLRTKRPGRNRAVSSNIKRLSGYLGVMKPVTVP